ncbi:unnamed protein product, partial [marine sediment metagenome]
IIEEYIHGLVISTRFRKISQLAIIMEYIYGISQKRVVITII